MSDRALIAGFECGPAFAAGAGGRVHRGVHLATGEAVAIKMLTGVERPDLRQAFEREAHAMAGFDHPHLMPIHEYGHATDGTPFMIMPLAEYGDLQAYADRLDWVTIGTLLLQILDGLAHAHARGVVHCDLKPENVLLRASAAGVRAQLADFGIARALRRADDSAEVRGTPHYMAPEQFTDPAAIGPAADLYAIGCIAWQLTTRRLPFEGRTALAIGTAHVNQDLGAWVDAVGAPPALGAWLARCLAKAPRARWPGAAEARAALRALVPAGQAVLPEPAETVELDSTEVSIAGPIEEAFAPAAMLTRTTDLAPPEDWRPPHAGTHRVGLGLRLFGARARPLVGRDAEADVLWRRVRGAHARQSARVVIIEGAQGTGKSHLANWMGMRADEVGAVRHLCARYADATPDTRGLTGLLRTILRTDGDLDRVRRLRGAAEEGASDGTVHTLAFGGRRLADRDAARTARVVMSWLSQWAAPRMPWLWLDDAQWDDEPYFLAEAALALDLPVIVVLTVRTDAINDLRAARIAALAGDRRVRRLPLAPLDSAAHHQLIDALLPLAPDVAAWLAERTHGRPLFAVHVAADWVAKGALLMTPDGLRPAAGSAEFDTLDALWMARITSLLGQAEAPTLGLAAALGEEVDDALLTQTAALAGITVLPDQVQQLVRAGLARRTPRGWAFAHGLIRDAILRRYDAPKLRAACARVLSTRVRMPQDWRAVSAHWRAAGQLETCIDAALKEYDGNAGNFTRHDYLDGLDRITRDLDSLGAPAHDARRLRIRLRRIASTFATSPLSQIIETLEAMEAEAQRHHHLAEWAEALRMRAIVLRNSVGAAPAEPVFRQAVNLFKRAGMEHAAACATLGRGPCLRELGRLDHAIEVVRAALGVFIGHDDPWWTQIARVELADLFIESDDFEPAEALMNAALREARAHNDLSNQARALIRLAERPLVQGQPRLAEAYLLQAHELYVQDENVNTAQLPSWLTRVALHAGDIDAAARHYADHDAHARSVTYRDECPWLAVVPVLTAARADDATAWTQAWTRLERRAGERWPGEARRDLAAALRLLPAERREPLVALIATL